MQYCSNGNWVSFEVLHLSALNNFSPMTDTGNCVYIYIYIYIYIPHALNHLLYFMKLFLLYKFLYPRYFFQNVSCRMSAKDSLYQERPFCSLERPQNICRMYENGS
jgi:hypothetical protein